MRLRYLFYAEAFNSPFLGLNISYAMGLYRPGLLPPQPYYITVGGGLLNTTGLTQLRGES